MTGSSRRAMLRGVVVTVVAGVAGYITAKRSRAAHPGPAGAANAYGIVPASSGRPLARVDQVSPATGLVVTNAGIVLTRTPDGTTHAFSAVCTHQGCTVIGVQNGAIACPCHGSRFDIRTGAPIAGPAPTPLAMIPIVIRDGEIYTAGSAPQTGTPSSAPPTGTPSSAALPGTPTPTPSDRDKRTENERTETEI